MSPVETIPGASSRGSMSEPERPKRASPRRGPARRSVSSFPGTIDESGANQRPGVTRSIVDLRSATAQRPRWLRQAPADAGARTNSSSSPPVRVNRTTSSLRSFLPLASIRPVAIFWIRDVGRTSVSPKRPSKEIALSVSPRTPGMRRCVPATSSARVRSWKAAPGLGQEPRRETVLRPPQQRPRDEHEQGQNERGRERHAASAIRSRPLRTGLRRRGAGTRRAEGGTS